MSIIYDALKKVEESTKRDLKVKTDRDYKPRPKTYLLYILVICLGFFIANIFFGFFTKPLQNRINVASKSDISLPQEPPKEAPSLQTELPVLTDAPKNPQPQLVLNGVFFSQNEGYALINNQIVKEGDTIDGATVMQITMDGVELKFEDSDIKLSTHTK